MVVLGPSLVGVGNLEEDHGVNLHTDVHRHIVSHSEISLPII